MRIAKDGSAARNSVFEDIMQELTLLDLERDGYLQPNSGKRDFVDVMWQIAEERSCEVSRAFVVGSGSSCRTSETLVVARHVGIG